MLIPAAAAAARCGLALYQLDMACFACSLGVNYEKQPPVPLIVFGGGHDAVPLVRLASEMGWHVTVVDGRPAAASRTRFPRADAATLMRAIEAIAIGVAPVLHGEGKGA